jgi:transcription initiation factor TFIIIB Brf1 subunit/transcription initiation factor TFIIB
MSEFDELSFSIVPGGKVKSSIMEDLKSRNFPEYILQKASEINEKMYKHTSRGKNRKKRLYYIIYCSYLELGLCPDKSLILEKFELTDKDVKSVDSEFSFTQTGYKPPSLFHNPEEFITIFCNRIGFLEDTISLISSICSNIVESNPMLAENSPQSLAAGMLQYYFMINGITIEGTDLTKITGLSKATICLMCSKISDCYKI